MAEAHRGTCFCGAVEIEAAGEPVAQGYCHCASCRSYSGAPVSTYTLWPAEAVRVTKGAELLAMFNKTGGISDRRFCVTCGGHVLVDHPTLGLADIHAATLPTLAFRPEMHVNYAESVLPMKDGLPKLKDFPVEAGGSGEVVPE